MNETAIQASGLSGPILSTTVVASEQGLESLATEWDALAERCDTALPFNGHAWASACWRHFHRHAHGHAEATVHVVVLREDGRAVAIAPLWIGTRRLPGFTLRVARWLGDGPSDYGDLLVEGGRVELAEVIARHLLGPGAPCQVVDLRECPSHSPSIIALRQALASRGGRYEVLPDSPCPAIDARGGWDAYMGSQFRQKRIKDLRREQRNLAQAGGFEFSVVDRLEALDALADAFGAVQAAHVSAGEARPGEFNDPAFRPFLDAVLAHHSARGSLRVGMLTRHGRVVAYMLGFSCRESCYLYNMAHDAQVQRYGAGKLLTLHLVERLMNEGHVLVDFMRGAEAYKASLTNLDRTNLHLRACGPGKSARIAWHLHVRILPGLESRWPRIADVLRHAGEQGLAATARRLLRRAFRGPAR